MNGHSLRKAAEAFVDSRSSRRGDVEIFDDLFGQEAANLLLDLRAAFLAVPPSEAAAELHREDVERNVRLTDRVIDLEDKIARAVHEAEREAEAAKALATLSMALGNPALEAHGDETLSDALVKYALSRIRAPE